MKNFKHAYQFKLFIMLNELNMRGKWDELKIGLKYMNKILTRNYIDIYWKYLFQYISTKLPKSIEPIPQFLK
jgi:hypothetical protein